MISILLAKRRETQSSQPLKLALTTNIMLASYVQFLFLTGARPSEVIALQWKHISNKSICFEQAVVNSTAGLVLKEGLKTQDQRLFSVNAQLLKLLEEMKKDRLNINPDELVFPSPEGKWIDPHNFRNRAWKTIVESLDIEYRKPYQTRHTFVTMALEADVSIPQIAKWVGNSPPNHYGKICWYY